MHRRPTTGWGSTRRLGPRGRRAARGGVTREPRRGDCCRAVRTSVIPRASLPPPLRAGATMGAGLTASRAGVLSYRLSVAARPMGLHGGSLRGPRRPCAALPSSPPAGKPTGSSPRAERRSRPDQPPHAPRSQPKAHPHPHPHPHRSGARVRLPVDLFEAFDAGVRVDLRRADARMTEQFLHRSQIGAAVYKMRGE